MAHGSFSAIATRRDLVDMRAFDTPKAYGGTDSSSRSSRASWRPGHRPTVFATGDSTCVGARSCSFEHAIWPPDDHAELRHASAAWGVIAASDFDVVHLNHPAARRSRGSSTCRPSRRPSERESELAAHYAAFPNVAFVAISRRQASCWEVPFAR